MHFSVEAPHYQTDYHYEDRCDSEGEVYYFGTFAVLLIVDLLGDASQKIVAHDEWGRAGGVAAVVVDGMSELAFFKGVECSFLFLSSTLIDTDKAGS